MNKSSDNIFDFENIMKMLDVTKLMSEFKIPGVDMESMLGNQRKNIEALSNANRLAFSGVQALMKRQTEILRQTLQELSQATQELATTTSPQERMAKQGALANETFERAVAHMRELSETLAKSNSEVFDVLNMRFNQIMDEVRQTIVKS